MNKMKTKKQNKEFILNPNGYWYANPNFTRKNSQQTKQNTSLRRKGGGYIKSDKTADTQSQDGVDLHIDISKDVGLTPTPDISFGDEKQELFQGGFRCGMVEGELKGAEATKKDVLEKIEKYFDKKQKQIDEHIKLFGKDKNRDIDKREKFVMSMIPRVYCKELQKSIKEMKGGKNE